MEIKTYTMDEWKAEGKRRFGPDVMQWRFVCPSCGHVQKPEDFRKYKDNGIDTTIAFFSCIGRFDGHMDVSIGSKTPRCNYTTGGLFNISPVKITDKFGEVHSAFDFDRGKK